MASARADQPQCGPGGTQNHGIMHEKFPSAQTTVTNRAPPARSRVRSAISVQQFHDCQIARSSYAAGESGYEI